MGEVLPLPRVGDVFDDARGGGRTMRVSQHRERGLVVVSVWAGATCRASFQLPAAEVPRLMALLGGDAAAADPADPADPPDAAARAS